MIVAKNVTVDTQLIDGYLKYSNKCTIKHGITMYMLSNKVLILTSNDAEMFNSVILNSITCFNVMVEIRIKKKTYTGITIAVRLITY